MKHLSAVIIFALFVLPAIAQENTDQAIVRCYYRFSQKKHKNDTEFFYQDTLTLDVGSKMSRYYDERKLREDSIFRSILSNYNRNSIKSISVLKNMEPDFFDRSLGDTYKNNTYDGVSEQIYKNRINGEIILLNTPEGMSSDWYKGNDPVGALNWAITPDTASFLNYTCQKANLHFRGRDYDAWFSPQIPINDGPWKFFGLPGLILKVKDGEGHFDFECIGLEYVDTPYAIDIPKYKFFECNRNEYVKVMNRKGGGQMININAGNITIVSFKADTSLLQLELE